MSHIRNACHGESHAQCVKVERSDIRQYRATSFNGERKKKECNQVQFYDPSQFLFITVVTYFSNGESMNPGTYIRKSVLTIEWRWEDLPIIIGKIIIFFDT